MANPAFGIKDSGVREQYAGGMVRDTQADKTLFSLIFDGPMWKRWAAHLTGGAKKYAARNWMKASGEVELERFKESAVRHFLQWLCDEVDEDHASAVFFNINGAEYVKLKIAERGKPAPVVIPKLVVSDDPADVLLKTAPVMPEGVSKRLDAIVSYTPSDAGPRATEVPKKTPMCSLGYSGCTYDYDGRVNHPAPKS